MRLDGTYRSQGRPHCDEPWGMPLAEVAPNRLAPDCSSQSSPAVMRDPTARLLRRRRFLIQFGVRHDDLVRYLNGAHRLFVRTRQRCGRELSPFAGRGAAAPFIRAPVLWHRHPWRRLVTSCDPRARGCTRSTSKIR
jgi:hypothetical protein